MNTMVELRLDARKQGGSERLACNLEFWTLMVELGQAFGWRQLGATYVATPIRKGRDLESRKRDYVPGAWRDAKRVDTKDAARWADALGIARASPHLNNMTKSRRGWLGQSNTQVDIRNRRLDAAFARAMDEFIAYLHKGAFSFAVANSEESAAVSAAT